MKVREKSKALDESNEDEFDHVLSELASFRYLLRKFLRFSESAARDVDITPQQHQLMLGIAGFTGNGKATVSELAEFLQERHHSVVGLIDRAVLSGLVRRESDSSDRRIVVVSLTSRGRGILKKLSLKHRDELNRLREELLRLATTNKLKPASESSTAQTSNKESHRTATHL
jgi:DNA-binding MarR family transcriptional regulator